MTSEATWIKPPETEVLRARTSLGQGHYVFSNPTRNPHERQHRDQMARKRAFVTIAMAEAGHRTPMWTGNDDQFIQPGPFEAGLDHLAYAAALLKANDLFDEWEARQTSP